MALTTKLIQKFSVGPEFYSAIQVTGDTSYPAGGYPVTPAQFTFSGFSSPHEAAAVAGAIVQAFGEYSIETENNSAFYATVDTSGNLRVFNAAGATPGTEVAAGTNVSTWSAILGAYGH